MNQTINTTIKTNENTEISNRFDVTRDFVALSFGASKVIPRIGETLLNTQRDTTTFFIDIKDHNFNFLTKINNL